jgi:hypothetical protein
MIRESEIERFVCQRCEELGWLSWKFTSPGLRGVPDRIIITTQGCIWFLEFKAPGQRCTNVQMQRGKELRERHHVVLVIANMATAEATMTRLMHHDERARNALRA